MAAKLETLRTLVRQEAGTNSAPASVGQQGTAPAPLFPYGIREGHTGTYFSQNWWSLCSQVRFAGSEGIPDTVVGTVCC